MPWFYCAAMLIKMRSDYHKNQRKNVLDVVVALSILSPTRCHYIVTLLIQILHLRKEKAENGSIAIIYLYLS